ncbi:uncharacterized protein LOC121864852 [Homarus americanus]|uniref:uncharacterized protein LOC121864852 n=1 Tax=Homarus americanus TaxID=6706 RepID=UPI001C454646|nr:uncharacterized protein LOC121864852 [Homarus americanus]XP_042219950.1 uncharacterized protein LOC121864852 [Homarus americanus]
MQLVAVGGLVMAASGAQNNSVLQETNERNVTLQETNERNVTLQETNERNDTLQETNERNLTGSLNFHFPSSSFPGDRPFSGYLEKLYKNSSASVKQYLELLSSNFLKLNSLINSNTLEPCEKNITFQESDKKNLTLQEPDVRNLTLQEPDERSLNFQEPHERNPTLQKANENYLPLSMISSLSSPHLPGDQQFSGYIDKLYKNSTESMNRLLESLPSNISKFDSLLNSNTFESLGFSEPYNINISNILGIKVPGGSELLNITLTDLPGKVKHSPILSYLEQSVNNNLSLVNIKVSGSPKLVARVLTYMENPGSPNGTIVEEILLNEPNLINSSLRGTGNFTPLPVSNSPVHLDNNTTVVQTVTLLSPDNSKPPLTSRSQLDISSSQVNLSPLINSSFQNTE